MIIFKLLFFVAVMKLFFMIEKPRPCALAFTLPISAITLLLVQFGYYSFLAFAISTIIRFGLSYLYFWLLVRYAGDAFWGILILGGILLLFV